MATKANLTYHKSHRTKFCYKIIESEARPSGLAKSLKNRLQFRLETNSDSVGEAIYMAINLSGREHWPSNTVTEFDYDIAGEAENLGIVVSSHGETLFMGSLEDFYRVAPSLVAVLPF